MTTELHHQYPDLNLDSTTYHCPTCDCEILESNKPIHEAVCARRHASGSQRPQVRESIVRQGSSSELPAPERNTQASRQPIIKRDDRRIAENKMTACPNCEKSVREQDLTNHINFDCSEGDKIPCEFCDKGVPMSSYSQHTETCSMRPQANQNNRSQSPDRNFAQERRQERELERQESEEVGQEEESHSEPEEERPQERDRSPQRGSSQGGSGTFMGFLQGLASTALQSYSQNREKPFISRGIAGLLSKVVGPREQTQEEQEARELENQRRERERQGALEARAQAQEEQRSRMRSLLAQLQQQPRGNSAERAQGGPQNGTVLVRTLERGPRGTVLIRTQRVPRSALQHMPSMSAGDSDLSSMGPFGLMMSMLGGQLQGQQGMSFVNPNAEQQEPAGLNKETIDSMSTVKYSQTRNKNLDEEARTCPICLEEFQEGEDLRFLWCMHRFHQKCVDSWLEKHTNCPICKKDFSEAEQDFSS